MPESLFTFRLIKRKELYLAIALQGSSGVPLHPPIALLFSRSFWVSQSIIKRSNPTFGVPYLTDNYFFSKLFGDHLGNVLRTSLEGLSLLDCAIRQSNLNFLRGKFAVVFNLHFEEGVEVINTIFQKGRVLLELPVATQLSILDGFACGGFRSFAVYARVL